jgi:hypothetical protein
MYKRTLVNQKLSNELQPQAGAVIQEFFPVQEPADVLREISIRGRPLDYHK